MVNTSDFRKTWCYTCGKYTLDLMYSCKTCKKYRLHNTCTELPEKIDCHPFHSAHALTVVFNGSSCCGKKHGKLLYYYEGCNFTVNPECTLNPTAKYEFVREGRIKHVLHNHPLTLAGNDVVGVEEGNTCLDCGKQCSSDGSYYSCNICRSFQSSHVLYGVVAEGYMASLSSRTPNDASSERSVVRSAIPCGRRDNVLTYQCSMCKVEMDPGYALKQTKHRDRHDTNKKKNPRSIPLNERVKQFFGGTIKV